MPRRRKAAAPREGRMAEERGMGDNAGILAEVKG